MVGRKELFFVVGGILCSVLVLILIIPVSFSGAWPYDRWWDINDDGKIDIQDLARISGAFGGTGANISKAGLLYDSGWINLTGQGGQEYTLVHNLNLTSADVIVDARHTVAWTGEWNKTYGGIDYDEARSMVQTSDGGYALAGYTMSFGIHGSDFYLVKTDAYGNIRWNKTYGGTSYDWAGALVQTGDGGYALAGFTDSFGAGDGDFWLVKTDANGNAQWNKTYGGTGWDWAKALVQTGDGGYALAGDTDSFGAGDGDFWLVKTDSVGNAQWNKTYGGTGNDYAYSLVQTNDGCYALAGSTNSSGAGGIDAYLVKTNSTGHMEWNKTYGGTGWDVAYALVQTVDGGYALAGGGFADLIKTDSVGNAQWNKTYGGTEAHALVQTADEGYALAGFTSSFGAGGYDFWYVNTDASGNAQWNRTYGGTGNDYAYSLVQTNDGCYALAGYTNSSGAGYFDFYLVKLGGEFGLAWTLSTPNSIMLVKDANPWNFIRVQIWQRRQQT